METYLSAIYEKITTIFHLLLMSANSDWSSIHASALSPRSIQYYGII
jgi:hypothetical protein